MLYIVGLGAITVTMSSELFRISYIILYKIESNLLDY